MKRLLEQDTVAALAWLTEQGEDDDRLFGFDKGSWPATVWLPHAMYETDDFPGGLTHDEANRIERAAGLVPPLLPELLPEHPELSELIENRSTLTGETIGGSSWPGPGWRRLHWAELGERLNVDPFAGDRVPSLRAFGYPSWPINIAPPAAGSLDREQFITLIDHLAAHSSSGAETTCFGYYSPLLNHEFDATTVYLGALDELLSLYDSHEADGSPTNLWPHDRTWVVYSNLEDCATKVSGDHALIAGLRDDEELEAFIPGS